MGQDCCGAKASELEKLRESQARVLKIVFAINAGMFLVEFASGWLARSTALLADSLDMFGDAFVYSFSLFVLYKSARWRASAALIKGLLMLGFGISVVVEAYTKVLAQELPDSGVMGGIGFLALLANSLCLLLLYRHRSDDINMKSTWICSRNDIIANCGVLVSALAVRSLTSKWPDIIIGGLIAAIFLKSAYHVLREAMVELQANPN